MRVSASIQVVLYADEDRTATRVMAALTGGTGAQVTAVSDEESCLAALHKGGNLVFCLEAGPEPDRALSLAERLRSLEPALGLVLLVHRRDFDVTRRALRSGILDVLVMPDELHAVPGAIRRAAEHIRTRAHGGAARGRVLAVYSAKGGSGRTLLAANLSLAQQTERRTLLLDLNLHFGGADVMLGLSPERSVVDLLPVIDELNETHLRNVTTTHPSGLSLILAPRRTALSAELTQDHARLILQASRRSFDSIVVDLPAGISSLVQGVLEEADRVLYVVTPDSLSIHTLKRTLPFLTGPVQAGKLGLVVNRTSPISEIRTEDIAKLVKLPIISEIRAGYREIQSAVNLGTPLLGPGGPKTLPGPARDIMALAAQLAR